MSREPFDVLLFGPSGQVGYELQRALAPLGRVVTAGRDVADLTDPGALRDVVRDVQPSAVVNAAAYTAVDRAESEPDVAAAVNATAPGVLAEEADRCGAWLVHYSTDYVFDGTATRPYREDDPTRPLGVYGRTKRDGERAVEAVGGKHLIVRTSWVYGPRRSNFLRTMLRLADACERGERDGLRVVDDQTGAPTSALWIADATARMLAAVRPPDAPDALRGTYHLASGGQTSWYGFARALFARFGRSVHVEAIPTTAYPTPAPRPAYSVLDTARVRSHFDLAIPTWSAQLAAVHDHMTHDRMTRAAPGGDADGEGRGAAEDTGPADVAAGGDDSNRGEPGDGA